MLDSMNLSGLNLDFNFVTCVLSNFNFVSVVAFFWPTKGPYYYYNIFLYIYWGGGEVKRLNQKKGFFHLEALACVDLNILIYGPS